MSSPHSLSPSPKSHDVISNHKLTSLFLHGLSVHRINKPDEWLKCLFLLKSLNNYPLAKKFSQRGSSFIEEDFNDLWASISPNSSPRFINDTMKTMLFWLKEDNLDIYNIIDTEGSLKQLRLSFDSNDLYCFQDWVTEYQDSDVSDIKDMRQKLSKVLAIINRGYFQVIIKRASYDQISKRKVISYDEYDLEKISKNYNRVYFYIVNNTSQDIESNNNEKTSSISNQSDSQDIVNKEKQSISNFIQTHLKYLCYFDYFFDPRPVVHDDKNTFNIFEGLLAKPVNHNIDISPILNHIKYVLANDIDNTDTNYKYIMIWLKRLLLSREKINVALMFTGMEGAGKGILFQKFFREYIYGDKYCVTHDSIKGLIKQFNGFLANKLLIICDETTNDITLEHYDKLKSLTTNTTREVEFKFKEQKTIKDFLNFVYCTNNKFPLPLSKTDRRFAVFDINDKYAPKNPLNNTDELKLSCKQYFNNLGSCFTSEHADQFLFYLSQFDDNSFDLESNIPETKARSNMQTASENPIDLFISEQLEQMFTDSNATQIKRTNVYLSYSVYCKSNNIKAILKQGKFYVELENRGYHSKKIKGYDFVCKKE